MGDEENRIPKKACACLTSLILAMGLLPCIAWADGDYPAVDERVYVGPETQTNVDVGNVTVKANDPSYDYGMFVHAKNGEDATGNVHGSVELTGDDIENSCAVVAYSDSNVATANVSGDITADIFAKGNGDLAVFGLDASAGVPGSQVAANVDGSVVARIARAADSSATLSAYGITQKGPAGYEGQPAFSRVVVNGDVRAESVNGSAKMGNEVAALMVDTSAITSSSTLIKGGVVTKGGRATGISGQFVSSASASIQDHASVAEAGATILVGKGGVLVSSDTQGGSAFGIELLNKGRSAVLSIGGDVTATTGDKQGETIGVYGECQAGKTDVLIDGTVTARTAGIMKKGKEGQLEVTVWKIDSDMIAATWNEEERKLVEDEAEEAAINYIIKVEQPQEGSILRLVGAAVKEAMTADGKCSFDVAHMGQKLYLDAEDGWTIVSAFNGKGEKIALDKDENGWFVIVPNGGGVYLSAQVAKVDPAPAPVPAPEPKSELVSKAQDAAASAAVKQYTIERVSGAPNWDEIEQLDIDDAEWGDSFGIRGHAKLCYDDDAIYVRMWAEEEDIRATYTSDDPDAKCYEDSCLEFFLSPMVNDARYMNFEFNPNCALCNEIGTQKENRERLHPASNVLDATSQRTEGGWEITYRIPFDYLREFYPGFNAEAGMQMRGNFYKCGNMTANKHYVVWNHVDSAAPNFHVPESFGALVFG